MTRKHSHEDMKPTCSHGPDDYASIALVTVTPDDSADYSLITSACNNVSRQVMNGVCRFDVGTNFQRIPACLANHQTAVIARASNHDSAPGTISLLDLSNIVHNLPAADLGSHPDSKIVSLLQSARNRLALPKRIIMFGMSTTPQRQLTSEAALPAPTVSQETRSALSSRLACLVASVLKTLKQGAVPQSKPLDMIHHTDKAAS